MEKIDEKQYIFIVLKFLPQTVFFNSKGENVEIIQKTGDTLTRMIKTDISNRDKWTLFASRCNTVPRKGNNLTHTALQLKIHNLNLIMRKHWTDTK